jgi:hypothetical protein
MKKLMWVFVVAIAACSPTRQMETRTYQLSRLSTEDAISLITPYIRERGWVGGRNRLISVREDAGRQKEIADLLKKYDGGGSAVDVVLDMQVIEADGFTGQDPAIADVAGTLQQMFKYHGYRLVGSTHIQVREESNFRQSGPGFIISGRTDRLRDENGEQRIPISVNLQTPPKAGLESTVTATIGKPVILGESACSGPTCTKSGAIILVIRSSIAPR